MASPFDASLATLLASISEAQDILGFIRDSFRVQTALQKAIDWQGEQTYEKRLATEFIKRELPPLQVIRNGLYVIMVAAFEQFLRETIIVIVNIRVSTAKRFGDLGDSFIKRHMDYSGRLLSMVHRPPAHLGLNYYDICQRLGTCQQESIDFKVNEVAFSNVKGITELNNFLEHVSDLGVKIQWDDLGRTERLQGLFHTKRTCDASKELASAFVKITEKRNRIAHSGNTVSDVDDGIFLQDAKIIQLTAEVITEHFSSKRSGEPKSTSHKRAPEKGSLR